ncbi:MAG: hypothetical protein GXO57_04310 [Thermodesulfobacteria bacterium]|nr:hypothetical protein [Thermodesulfobacteriota bacterium]
MQNCELKKELINIQVAIKKEDYDKALELYQKIFANWDYYTSTIDPQELESLFKLIDYIQTLLIEKNKEFQERRKFLNMRKTYAKY